MMPPNTFVFISSSILILLIISSIFMSKKSRLLESFQTQEGKEQQVEYMRIVSKLSKKAVQPYKGDIDTTLTVNTIARRDAKFYYPQLWLYSTPSGHLQNVGTGGYLTVSDDRTKVVLAPLSQNKKKIKGQQWLLDASTGFITSRLPNRPAALVLHLEGSNDQENAMVVVTRKGEGPAFQWFMEKVAADIRNTVLLGGTLGGKTEHKTLLKLEPSHVCAYSLWVSVGGMDYKKGQLKNIFKQGANNTPGLYISPTENRFQVLWDKQESVVTRKFTFELDTWYHIALVMNQNKLQIYIDGQVTEEFLYNTHNTHSGRDTIVFCNKGGFDGLVANAEYTNKALTITEINQRMSATNPRPACKEQPRVPTNVPGNLSKDPLDQWALDTTLAHVKKNALCPPNTLGGTTLSFRGGNGNVRTRLTLLENQYYEVSIWALSEGSASGSGAGLNIRPYYKSHWDSAPVWTGEWQVAPATKPPQWKEYKWAFTTTVSAEAAAAAGAAAAGGEFGFEINTKDKMTRQNGLFLPTIILKVLAATTDANVVVKEFRSNGTHNTCSIAAKDIGLDATGGWCALKNSRDEYYVEANFDNLYQIDKIHTRGRGDYPQWTTEYRLEYYDVYYNQWRKYGGTFEANKDMHTVKTNRVSLLTDKIRLYAVSFQSWPALRLAFSGSISLKDQCTDYKIKSAHHVSLAERARNLKLFNQKCKTVSYEKYQTMRNKLLQEDKKTKSQVQKLQIDLAASLQNGFFKKSQAKNV